MGVVSVTCTSGCTCFPPSLEIDALDKDHHVSVQATATLNVTQHPHCRLRLTVQERTNAPGGERKFKLLGLDIRPSSGAIAVGRVAPKIN